MTHFKRLTRLMHDAAEQAAPSDLDLWPAIRAQIQPQASTPPRRVRGAITLIVASVLVITVGLILALHGDRDRDPVHTASLNQTADPQLVPAAYQPTPVPTQQFCKAYASYDEDKTLYRDPDVNSRAVYNPIHAESSLIVWDDRNIDGETWYNVSLYYFSVEFRGWVQGEPAELYECGTTPAAYPGIGSGSAYPVLVTYTSPTLGLAVQVPGGWTPYEDQTLNRLDQQIGSLSFFESAEDAGPFDPDNLPAHGSAIIVINGQDRSVFAAGGQGNDLSAEDILRPLLGTTPELDGTRILPYPVDHGDQGITLYLLLVPPDSDIVALSETLLEPTLKAAGVPVIDFTYVRGTHFSDQGVYTHTSALTTDTPRRDYYVAANGLPAEPLAQADRYVIFSVAGTDYTPNLSVSAPLAGNQYAGYRTNDGAVLTQWYDQASQENQDPKYLVAVEGNLMPLRGDFTFSIRPVTDVIDLAQGPQDVHLSFRQPQVVRYDPGEGGQVHLDIVAGLWMEASDIPAPDVAVILPDGVTLTRFNPDQTTQLNLTFTPAPDSAPLILFYPLDTDAHQDRREIALFVSTETQSASNTGTESSTPAELAGTIVLPEGTVAVSIPQSGYVVMDGDAAGLVGQTARVSVSLLYVDVDDQTQIPAGVLTTLPPPGDSAARQVTQVIIPQAVVVSAGPYLAQFSSDQPELNWATGEEAWGAVTLAVSPQDALTLQWAIEAQIPVILSRAK